MIVGPSAVLVSTFDFENLHQVLESHKDPY